MKRIKPPSSKWKLKWTFFLVALASLCSVSVWLVFFAPLFRIEYVNVSSSGIEPGYVRTLIFKFMDSHTGIFSGQNLLFFNTKKASEYLAMVLHIDAISFDKKFPKTLHITVTGKPFRAVVYHQSRFYDLSSQGNIMQEIDGTTLGSYPILLTQYGTAGSLRISKKQATKEVLSFPVILFDNIGSRPLSEVQINTKTLSAILDSAKTFVKDTIPVFIFRVGSSQEDFIATTFEGWYIRLSSQEDIQEQWKRLQTFLLSIDKKTRKSLEYIDVRFGNRVYYKSKT